MQVKIAGRYLKGQDESKDVVVKVDINEDDEGEISFSIDEADIYLVLETEDLERVVAQAKIAE